MTLTSPTEQQIYDQVRHAVADILRLPVDRITKDARLGEDLGMESIDYVDLQFRLESEFGIQLYPGSAVDRLRELLAPNPLETDGLLTPFGASVLRLRLPEIDRDRLREGQPAAGIEALFTSMTWVRVITELLDARPEKCPHCQASDLEATKPAGLTCTSCDREVPCPDGEACLVAWAETVPKRIGELRTA